MQIFSQGHSGVAADREGYLMLSPLQLLWVLGPDWIDRQQGDALVLVWSLTLRLLRFYFWAFRTFNSPCDSSLWGVFSQNKKVIKLWTSGQDFSASATKDENYRIKKINKFSRTTPRTLGETSKPHNCGNCSCNQTWKMIQPDDFRK